MAHHTIPHTPQHTTPHHITPRTPWYTSHTVAHHDTPWHTTHTTVHLTHHDTPHGVTHHSMVCISVKSHSSHVTTHLSQSEGSILSNLSDLVRNHEILPKIFPPFKEQSCYNSSAKNQDQQNIHCNLRISIGHLRNRDMHLGFESTLRGHLYNCLTLAFFTLAN